MFICPKKSFLNFSSEGDGFSKPAKSSNSKPSKDLLDLDFGNPVAQPPPPQRTGKTESPLKIGYNGIYQNDLFLVILSFSFFHTNLQKPQMLKILR